MVEYILDTDIGSDCDDAGAIALLHRLERNGECKVLAMTNCISRESAPACIDAINRYYGRPDIPIGTLPLEGYYPKEIKNPYTNAIQKEFESSYPVGSKCESSVKVLRKAIAEADNKVALCSIGVLTNLRLLLQSAPDEFSPLNGVELVKNKVFCLYIMCGDFSENYLTKEPEFNVRCDIESAKYVFENFPSEIEILPCEIGERIKVGTLLLQEGKKENPVRRCYELYCNCERFTWDIITALLMVRPDEDYWVKTEKGTVTVNDDGRTVFTVAKKGNCRYIKGITKEYDVKTLMEELIAEPY